MSKKKDTVTVHVPVGEHFILEAQIPTKIEIKIDDPDFGKNIEAIMESESSKMSVLAQLVGLDPKKDFVFSNLDDVDFSDEGDFWENANFRGTSLMRTIWNENTSLRGILLEGANLTGAQGLTEEALAHAYTDQTTILPEQLSREKIRALHEALNMPKPKANNEKEKEVVIAIPVDATLHPKM